jgi:drug/metabolite transporter (DMT)-like permease
MEARPAQPHPDPPAWAIMLGFACIYISWGTTFLAIKWGVQVERIPPALFGGARVGTAGLILLAYVALRGHSLALSWRDLKIILVTAVLMFVGGNGLLAIGQTTLESSVAAVLTATGPLWIGMLGWCWGDDRLSMRGWLGLIVGLAGVLLLFGPELDEPAKIFRDWAPFCVLGSAATWAIATLLVRHHRPGCSYLTAAAWQMTIGGATLFCLGIIFGEPAHMPARITGGVVIAFLYLLIVGSFVGFIAYNWLLLHVSAAKVGTHAYVNPAVAVVIGWAIGEPFTWWLVGGICVILIGVALVRSERAAQVSARPSSAIAIDMQATPDPALNIAGRSAS